MAKVSKLKNEGGSPVEVQDYDLKTLQSQTAKTASEVSTTAQYVPLQDINGNIVKISMQSMQEAMRNVLGSLLINNDKGTSITGIAGLSGSGSSIDFGSITPANLASLLGVPVSVVSGDYSSGMTISGISGLLILTTVYVGVVGLYSIGYNSCITIYETSVTAACSTITMSGYSLTISGGSATKYWIFRA